MTRATPVYLPVELRTVLYYEYSCEVVRRYISYAPRRHRRVSHALTTLDAVGPATLFASSTGVILYRSLMSR